MRIVLRAVLLGVAAMSCLAGTTSLAAAACPNESLRYGFGADLPDCRAYEQATPVEKDGAGPQPVVSGFQAAEEGNRVVFYSEANMPGAVGAEQLQYWLASRGSEGWSTQGLLPPASSTDHFSVNTIGWTPDLTQAYDIATQLEPLGLDLFARDNSTGAVTTVVTSKAAYRFVGASAGGNEVFFEAFKDSLTPEAAANKHNLYVWDRSTSAISLVGVLPSSACASPPCVPAGGSFGGPYLWWDNGARITTLTNGGASESFFTQEEHVVSENGHRAYFTAGATGQIYLREDPTSPAATTVQVSASQKTNGSGPGGADPNGPQPAAFMMATPDGSQAFFTSPEELTNAANTGTADEGNDLYRYEAGTGQLADLTVDPGDPAGAEVQGVLGVSKDGAYVYFAANGDLDGSGPATRGNCGTGAEGAGGECNIYLWHDGRVVFVARVRITGGVSAEGGVSDGADWASRGYQSGGNAQVISTARVSADGRVLLFRSQRKLTAYENNGVPEFYRYDAETGAIDCVTCNPEGTPPVSAPTLETKTAFVTVGGLARFNTRNLSSSGDQVFFETAEALVPADKNRTTDVYEWEADGAGSCESEAQDGGCLYLISTGNSGDPSYFADASASGNDVFIFTDQPLVGQDQDDITDVYDARVNGGLASQEVHEVAPCAGEECKKTASPTLLAAPPASFAFSGAGNITAPNADCASVEKRARHLRQRAKAARLRVRKLRRVLRRRKAGNERSLRRRLARARVNARRAQKNAGAAEATAKRCLNGGGGAK